MLTLVGPAQQLDRMNVVWSPPLLPSSLQPKVLLPPSFASFALGPTSELGCFPRAPSLVRSFFFLRRPRPILLSPLPFFPSPIPPSILCGPFLPRKTTSLVPFEDFFVSAPLSKAPRLLQFTRRRYRLPEKWFFPVRDRATIESSPFSGGLFQGRLPSA